MSCLLCLGLPPAFTPFMSVWASVWGDKGGPARCRDQIPPFPWVDHRCGWHGYEFNPGWGLDVPPSYPLYPSSSPRPVYARESVVAGRQYGAPATPAATTAVRQQPSSVQLERVWQQWLPSLLLVRRRLGLPAFPPLYFPSPGAALLGATMCGLPLPPPSSAVHGTVWRSGVTHDASGLSRPILLRNAKWGGHGSSRCASERPKKKTGEIRHDGGAG